MEGIEEQFITSYKSNLAKEGAEVCKEILVYIKEKEEMTMEKAKLFCDLFRSYKLDGVDCTGVLDKCEKYLIRYYNFHKYYNTYKTIENDRKSWLDMDGRRIKNL